MRLEKFVWTAVAAGVALLIGTAPIDATMTQGPKPKPTVAKTTPKAKTTTLKVKTTSSPKTQSAPKVKKTAPAPKVKSAKSTTKPVNSSKPVKSTKVKGGNKTAGTTTTSTDTGTSTGSTTTPPAEDGTSTGTDGGTTTTEPLSKAQLQLTKNTKLQSKMQQRLGLADTQAVLDAASGFKNLGQFVAAANVSNNLGIPFADLKLAMTGIDATGARVSETTMSLGQAIQSLKGLDSTTASTTANTAMTQANTEVQTTTTSGGQ